MPMGEPSPDWPYSGNPPMTSGTDPAMHATLRNIERLLEQLVENTKREGITVHVPFGSQENKDSYERAVAAVAEFEAKGGEK